MRGLLLVLAACRGDKVSPVETGEPPEGELTVVLSPDSPFTDDVITAAVTDASGSALTADLSWQVDGVAVSTESQLDGAQWFSKGQTVSVTATAESGEGAAEVVVVNTPPSTPTVTLTQDADGALTCAASGEDADGDALTTHITWDADGVAFTDTSTPERVEYTDLARGAVWRCTAWVNDGEDDSASADAELPLTGPAYGGYWFEPLLLVERPTSLVALPDGRLLIGKLNGEVLLVDPETGTIEDEMILWDEEEDEMTGMVLDPNFGDGVNDFIYGWFARDAHLMRWELTLNPLHALDGVDLLAFDNGEFAGHSGGDILWWDGETDEPALYLAIGPHLDATPADGQKDDTIGNALVALSVDAKTLAVSPALDSPFEETALAAIGLRNPWRIVDCGAALCVPDPGNDRIEEINIYTGVGQNFGSPVFEGPGDGTFDEPAASWSHDEWSYIDDDPDNRGVLGYLRVPTAGAFVQGGYAGRLDNHLLYGEFYDGWIRAMELDEYGEPTGQDVHVGHMPYMIDMEQTPDGTLYALDYAGTLRRMIYRADRAVVGAPGAALSASDYDTAVPYDLIHPFWSNGAEKFRRISLPSGAVIDNSDPDSWTYPDGTRVYKHFTMDGVDIETRVLEKQGDMWVPGTYVYDGADAWLTDGTAQEITLSDGTAYPILSESACEECHGPSRGQEWPLALNPLQLGDDNLAALYAAGLLSVKPDPAPTPPGDSEEQAVRAYLHANCSFCHQPAGLAEQVSFVELDWRYDAELPFNTGAWYYDGASPWNPNIGDPLLVRGDPDRSVTVAMMEEGLMPPVGVWQIDEEGIALIRDWLDGLSMP